MEFKQKNTGATLKTNNEFVIKQLQKSDDYEEVKHFTKEEKPETKKKND